MAATRGTVWCCLSVHMVVGKQYSLSSIYNLVGSKVPLGPADIWQPPYAHGDSRWELVVRATVSYRTKVGNLLRVAPGIYVRV